MMVWKRQLPSKMAIFGIYVRFLGCISIEIWLIFFIGRNQLEGEHISLCPIDSILQYFIKRRKHPRIPNTW